MSIQMQYIEQFGCGGVFVFVYGLASLSSENCQRLYIIILKYSFLLWLGGVYGYAYLIVMSTIVKYKWVNYCRPIFPLFCHLKQYPAISIRCSITLKYIWSMASNKTPWNSFNKLSCKIWIVCVCKQILAFSVWFFVSIFAV